MGNIESNMTEQTNKGNLHIYIGPMYAGKTTKLINTTNNHDPFIPPLAKCALI